jgi:hypothetical protein
MAKGGFHMTETTLPPDNGFHATEPEADSTARSVPEDAMANMMAVAEEVGGVYKPRPGTEGAVAYTHFDTRPVRTMPSRSC